MILDKLQRLKDKLSGCDGNTETQLDDWAQEIQNHELLLSLKNHDGMKVLLDRANERLDFIETRLSADDLKESERKDILRDRYVIHLIIDPVEEAQEDLNAIESEIDQNLK